MKREVILEQLRDAMYFIQRFFYIVNKQQQRVPFQLNSLQKDFINHHSQNDLILKARKQGFSSLIEALWLHACMFNRNENAVTMAHTWEDTQIHLDRVKFFIDNMGVKNIPIVVELDKDNQRELFFPNTNSRYWIGTAGAKAFGRGRDITKLHLSEVAFYPSVDAITAVDEACVQGAWKIFETTANGVGNIFFRLWKDAERSGGTSPWKPNFYAWWQDPTYQTPVPTTVHLKLSGPEQKLKQAYNLTDEQVYWYRLKQAAMPDKSKMPQEYPSNPQEAFLSSGRPAFDQQMLQVKIERAQQQPPTFRCELEDDGQKVKMNEDQDGRLLIWKAPRRGRSYLIAADSGEGVRDGDYSVAQVFDRSSWEQVARWRGRIDPGDFGRTLVTLGKYYDWAVLAPELNNHGWATVEAIKAEKYPHLLNTKQLWKEDETPRDGFPTNEKTRAYILTAMRNAIDNNTSVINDVDSLAEMQVFVQNERTGKFEAMEGFHDDCVISYAIGVYCLGFLTVDETYDDDSRHRHGSPIAREPEYAGARRRSATGYR